MTAGDVIADMSLSSLVQCVQKLVKLILGLATEHRQQLLVLNDRRHRRVDGIHLFSAKNLGLIEFTDKSGILGIQGVHQEHVVFTDKFSVNESVIKTWTTN